MDKTKLIIYTTGFTMASEKCRDWEVKFIPMTGDLIRLQDFNLFNNDNTHELNATYRVIGRTLTQEVLYVHLELVEEDPYDKKD